MLIEMFSIMNILDSSNIRKHLQKFSERPVQTLSRVISLE